MHLYKNVINTVMTVATLSLLQTNVYSMVLEISSSQKNIPDVQVKLVNILKFCFQSRLNTLVVTEDLSEVAQNLNQNMPLNIFLIDANFIPIVKYGHYPRWAIYLLGVKSQPLITSILQKFPWTELWNPSSTFFIVNNQKDGCDNASQVMQEAWSINLLEFFYICEQSKGKVLLYTYNPFTSRVIDGWERVKIESDKRWTLHKQAYSNDNKMCEKLEFDKTKHLDRYEVKAVTTMKSKTNKFAGRNDDLDFFKNESVLPFFTTIINLFSTLNITVSIDYYSSLRMYMDYQIGYMRAMIIAGYDIVFSPQYLFPHRNIINTRAQLQMAILTKHRDFLTPIDKIRTFFSLEIAILLCLAMLITCFIFIYKNNGQLFLSALEVLRILLSKSVSQPLRSIPMRIYLLGICWLIFIVNATIQGHINLFFTKPEKFDVKTLENLKRYDYHIFINSIYFDLISNHLVDFPKENIHIMDREYDCHKYVLENSTAACIETLADLFPQAVEYNLNLSPLLIGPWIGLWHRRNWPLEKKLDTYIARAAAAGLLNHWHKQAEDIPLEKYRHQEDQETNLRFFKIRLSDFKFVFMLLAAALSVATCCFMLEIYLAKIKLPWKIRQLPREK